MARLDTARDQDTSSTTSSGTLLNAFTLQARGLARRWGFYVLISVGTILAVIGLWWLAAYLHLVKPVFLPSPGAVWAVTVTSLTEGYRGHLLTYHLGLSLMRIGVAFLIATGLAIPLGILVARSKWVSAILQPGIHFYRVLPPLSYYMMLVVWMGIGEGSKITLLALAGFPPIFIAVIEGYRGIPLDRIRAASSLGASNSKILKYVILPSLLPDIFTGMRVSMGFIYTTLVSAEMVAATAGIGWLALNASRFLRTDAVFMAVIAMGITGLILDGLIKLSDKWLVPWRGKG
ncbi:MAG: ABC transporter permease [Alcaligenaceae bacterium]|nr:ABC transporter permease [Alcaligenaceae bacterium]